MTKAQVLALPNAHRDDYVAEQVMQWGRAASVNLDGGAVEVPNGAWTRNSGNTAVTRRDGSTFGPAPNYDVLAVDNTPDFAAGTYPQQVLFRMIARNFVWEIGRSGVNASVLCFTGARPAVPDPVVLPDLGDAIVRAALVAVQP